MNSLSGWRRVEAPVAATVFLLAVACVLGGASQQNEVRLALVELASLPLLVIAGRRLVQGAREGVSPLGLAVLVAAMALPILQLIPLPMALWSVLPGREEPKLALDLAGLSPAWLPLSLTPERTWRAFLALIPPIAMVLGAASVSLRARRLLAIMVVGVALVGIVLGAAQLVSGGDRLYPWRTTDAGSVVGFFANRNHLASLCLVALPFAVVLGARDLRRGGGLRLWASGLFLVLTVVALAVIRSRAGVLLLWPVLGASLVAAWVASGRGRPRPMFLVLIGGATVATIIVAVFALNPLIDRFDRSSNPEGRFENWPIVAAAADTYLPIGSGLGSFDAVYRSVEPLERLDATYFNQAHNDYLESWLEAGWSAVIVLALFLFWYVRRSAAAWRADADDEGDLQRAASIAIAVVLLHSAGDYPLRTETIAVIFAFCCGVLDRASGRRLV